MVTHPSIHWARRGLTSFMRQMPLTTMPHCGECVCVCLSACISETASANFTHFCAVYVWSWLGRPLAALQYVNFWLSGWRQLCKYWLERGNKKGIYSKWLTRWQHQLNAMVHAKTWLSRRQRQIRGGICVMSITALWLLILINDKK